MALQATQIIQDRYRIVSAIGKGGFGAVYRAWDLRLKRPCAIKENVDTRTEAQAQFNREVQLLANLQHNNLPRVYDYFFLPEQGQYLVMDFIEGQNLQTRLDEQGPIPEKTLLPWMQKICEAMAYLHAQEPPVIHRDIKPANIIVTRFGQAVLVDFGISKVYNPDLKTDEVGLAVTTGFSPWEQYGQGSTDNRSDIYALGATMYALLSGEDPPDSVVIMSGLESLSPLHKLKPDISPKTAAAVMKALQIQPANRFATAEKFLDALTPAVASPRKQSENRAEFITPPKRQQPFFRCEATGQKFTCRGRNILIGRLLRHPVSLKNLPGHEAVSRTHANLMYRNGQYWLKDEFSSNGTIVNDKMLEAGEVIPLKDRSRVQFGVDGPILTFHLLPNTAVISET